MTENVMIRYSFDLSIQTIRKGLEIPLSVNACVPPVCDFKAEVEQVTTQTGKGAVCAACEAVGQGVTSVPHRNGKGLIKNPFSPTYSLRNRSIPFAIPSTILY